MPNNDFVVFYHPSNKPTVLGRYLDRSCYSTQRHLKFPEIFRCAHTGKAIVPPVGLNEYYRFAAKYLLPICVDRFLRMQSREGIILQSTLYGIIIPCGLFLILSGILKAALSWTPINCDESSLDEAAIYFIEKSKKEKKKIAVDLVCISLPLSILIAIAYLYL